MADKLIKQINTAKDLEGIQPMDIVMINSYTKFNPDVPAQNAGFYGGSFDINNEKYLVVSETFHIKESKDRYFVSSSLYQGKERRWINNRYGAQCCRSLQ